MRGKGLLLTVSLVAMLATGAGYAQDQSANGQTGGSGDLLPPPPNVDPYSTAVDPQVELSNEARRRRKLQLQPDAEVSPQNPLLSTLTDPTDPASSSTPADPNGEPLPDPNEPLSPGTALDPLKRGSALGLRNVTIDDDRMRSVVRPAEAVKPMLPVTGAPPLPVDRESDARNEYNALGIRVGSFTVGSSLTGAAGYQDKSGDSASSNSSSSYVRSELSVTAKSDWEVHSLEATGSLGLRQGLDSGGDLTPTGSVSAIGRLDFTEVDKLTGNIGWQLKDDDDAVDKAGKSVDDATVAVYSGGLGYERNAGLIGVALKGAIERNDYEMGTDRTNTVFTSSIRLSLQDGATLTPFIEGGPFMRVYDKQKDANGYKRNSLGGEGKVGVAFDNGVLTGEAAIGYAYEQADDSRLDALQGVTGEASIAWAVTPLTTVSLKGSTSFEPTQTAKASGSVKRSVDGDVAYALQPNLIVTAGAGFSYQDYEGVEREDLVTSFRGGASWRINTITEIGLTATHSVTDSTASKSDGDETSVELSVTLRH